MTEEKIILIDGIRYHADRPSSCRFCYWWKNRKKGCILGKENCYYLAESPETNPRCENCGYKPCFGICFKDIDDAKGVNKKC